MALSMQPQSSPSDSQTEPNTRILLVDDNPANLVSLHAILDELGHKLVEAQSGEEALERIESDEFAVILLDVLMPGIDGFETARRMRGRFRSRRTPIIFLRPTTSIASNWSTATPWALSTF